MQRQQNVAMYFEIYFEMQDRRIIRALSALQPLCVERFLHTRRQLWETLVIISIIIVTIIVILFIIIFIIIYPCHNLT